MQIVIDIPAGLKNIFETEQWTALSCMEMKDALMNGTPLPKGEWILQSNGKCKLCAPRFECSNCGKMTFDESNYCPRCGAEMESD